jgi:hypothetical protein
MTDSPSPRCPSCNEELILRMDPACPPDSQAPVLLADPPFGYICTSSDCSSTSIDTSSGVR